MAIRVRTLKPRDLSHQMGEGVPNHVSPMGSMFVNTLNGDIYHNRDGCVCWELSVSHITDTNAKLNTDQPDKYGSDNLGVVINDVNKEIPVGVIDGVNKEFILSKEPRKDTEYIFLNGVLAESGPGNTYTIEGNKIIFRLPIPKGFNILASYQAETKVETKMRVDREKPIFVVDKHNELLLKYSPVIGSESVFLNGVLVDSGADGKYVINGNKIIFNQEIPNYFSIIVSYSYIL